MEQKTLTFATRDVTGTIGFEAENVPAGLLAGAVAKSLAYSMSLPDDVPWALRSDSTAGFLADDVAIGDQITSDETLTIVPRTHLA